MLLAEICGAKREDEGGCGLEGEGRLVANRFGRPLPLEGDEKPPGSRQRSLLSQWKWLAAVAHNGQHHVPNPKFRCAT